jgi:hypothetical protein
MTIHSYKGVDLPTLRQICKGEIQWRKCPDCDAEGLQHWDYTTGEDVSPASSGIPKENIESAPCTTCKGLGYQLYRVK